MQTVLVLRVRLSFTRILEILTVDLTAVRLMVLAKTDMGLMATEGREMVVRAAVRRAEAKAREAMILDVVTKEQ